MNHKRQRCLHFLFSARHIERNPTFGIRPNERSRKLCADTAVMTTALSRCYSTVNGVKKFEFVPATNQEFAEVKALGENAVAPLAGYLDLEPKNGFTQLFAVKSLMTIGGASTLGPLKRAFAQDQWEVTRMAALDGMFEISKTAAKPYLEVAFEDKSPNVRHLAESLWTLYKPHKSDNER